MGTRWRFAWLFAVAAVAGTTACGGASAPPPRSSRLSDDAIADFGAMPGEGDFVPEPAARAAAAPSAAPAIELADGERFVELRALIRFRASAEAQMHCALYALEQTERGLVEGRKTVGCDDAGSAAELPLAPVEDARGPHLHAALLGARPASREEPTAALPGPDGAVRHVHVWLATDRRVVDGDAAPVRWPTPAEEGSEVALGRSPATLSEIWEAVMYPERYRAAPN